jgi:hypothetical protein
MGRASTCSAPPCLTPSGHARSHRYSLASSRLSDGFFLPIPIDRAASSYQSVDLSLAVFLLNGRFPITDPLSFEVGAPAPPFLGNALLPLYRLILSCRRRGPSHRCQLCSLLGAPVRRRSSRHQSANCYTKWSNEPAYMALNSQQVMHRGAVLT